MILLSSDYGIPAALVSLLSSSAAAPIVYRALLAAKSRQTVSQHLPEHAAKQGTPTMGGLIVLIGLAAGMSATWQPVMLPALVIVGVFALVGFLDDFLVPRLWPGTRGLGWAQKLILQLLGTVIPLATWQSLDLVPLAIATFLILFFSNAYNFADGLDSLAGGFGLIWALGMIAISGAAFSQVAGQDALNAILASLAAGFIPFLWLNAPPARVFMGDVGALPIGALMGWCVSLPWLAEEFVWHASPATTIAVGLAVFGILLVELVPVPLQILSVKLRKKRLFAFKTPIHHGLQDAGWPETQIAWRFHLLQIGLTLIALAALTSKLRWPS